MHITNAQRLAPLAGGTARAAGHTPAAAPRPAAAQHRRRAVCAAASSPAAGGSARAPVAPPSPSPAPKLLRYPGLRGADFQHPLDRQNTALLRTLPGLELLARTLMGETAERLLLLENISTSVRVGPDQLQSLHVLLLEAAAALDMPSPPELYVRQNPVPNAYTLAVSGRTPFIVVHTSLLELLDPDEVRAVLAHELGHLACDHGVWLTLANMLAGGAAAVLPGAAGALEGGLLRWVRAAELSCDRAALLVAGDARVVVSALMKLAGGSAGLAGELSVEAFLRQARSYDDMTLSSPLGWFLRNAQTRALSHPLPVLRAREVDDWAGGEEYAALRRRGV